MVASFNGDQHSMHTLIGSRANVNHTDAAQWTALLYACQNGHEACVNALLHAGADEDHSSNHGTTALMITCQMVISIAHASWWLQGAILKLLPHQALMH